MKKPVYTRNPIYLFYALGASAALIVACLIAVSPSVGIIERSLFYLFYGLPGVIKLLLGSLIIAAALAGCFVVLLYHRLDILLRFLLAGVSAFAITFLLSQWLTHGRPETILSDVSPILTIPGFAFPSYLAAIALAGGLVIAVYAPKTARKLILWAALLIGCSGLLAGASLPIDIIAGWLVGIFCYSLTLLALGSPYTPIKADKLATKLMAGGLPNVTLRPAAVDARGSVPFFGESNGREIFVKVFNRDNNAADWIFKLIRRVQYRRLEDEVPSLSPKRAIEHEAYISMVAKHTAKVRTPEILGMYKVGANSYAMASIKIDSTGMDKLDKNKLTDAMLDAVWQQIGKLHKSHIIHKDLRAANVMIENITSLPWMIDFGFSECAVSPRSFYKDNVEFIASSATKVGAKRAVAAAHRALGNDELLRALPYMQYAALSGATTTDLKNQPVLIETLRKEMLRAADVQPGTIQKAKINRLSYSRRIK